MTQKSPIKIALQVTGIVIILGLTAIIVSKIYSSTGVQVTLILVVLGLLVFFST